MKKQTFALYFGNRGFMPAELIESAREDMVKAVIGNIVVRIVIADQIIFSIFCYHLVRAYNILPFGPVRLLLWVHLLICSVLGILESHLAVMADRLIQQFNIQKNLLVIGFIFRQSGNMPDPRAEINIG